MEGFSHVIQAPFQTVGENDFYLKGKWPAAFFGNHHPVILELGCGKGEYTVQLAEKFPENNYLGVDIKGARMWKGAKMSATAGLKNVGFLRTNIEMIARFFEPGEVDEIWLTFPDPQMKKTKKRLTSTGFLNEYRKILKPGGVVHLKTDSLFQYTYTRMMAVQNGFEMVADTDDLYQSEMLNEILQIKTFYEKQWISRGITIKYLAFRLNDNTLTEPDVEIQRDDYRSFGRSAREIHDDF